MIEAIQNLHERGFVHRDLKPSNFVFRGDEKHMELFLIGFGLAKRWCSPEGEVYPPPWKEKKNKDEVYCSKEMFGQKEINLGYYPSGYKELYNEIKSLNFDDKPDYDDLMYLLDSMITDQTPIDDMLPQSNPFHYEDYIPNIPYVPSESSSTIEGSLSETISDHSIKEKSQNESEAKVEGGCCFLS